MNNRKRFKVLVRPSDPDAPFRKTDARTLWVWGYDERDAAREALTLSRDDFPIRAIVHRHSSRIPVYRLDHALEAEVLGEVDPE